VLFPLAANRADVGDQPLLEDRGWRTTSLTNLARLSSLPPCESISRQHDDGHAAREKGGLEPFSIRWNGTGALALWFGRIFFDEPAPTSSENALDIFWFVFPSN